MDVSINGKVFSFDKPVNIDQILERMGVAKQHGVAVAQNHTVILKSEFERTFVQDGDELEIIHATAGG